MMYYSSHYYHSNVVSFVMIIMKDTNKDVKYFKKEFSLENILLSIRKLRKQIKQLETQRMYDAPIANN